MRATHGIILAASALTVGLIIIGLNAKWSTGRLETGIANAIERQAKLRSELLRTRRGAVAGKTDATAIASPEPPKAAPKTERAFPARIRPPGLLDFARDNPQLWNEFIQSKRAELGRLNLPLLQRLGLTAEQQERFKDIFAAHIARGADIGAAADAKGLTFADPAIAALSEESEKQRKRELAELLGPAGFHEFEDFERALPVRGFVDGFATQVAGTVPLTAQQAEQLERALAQANETYRSGKPANPRQVDWERVDLCARAILSPQQFAVWELGTAHNMFGGSRRDQELEKVYEGAVKRMKEAGSATAR